MNIISDLELVSSYLQGHGPSLEELVRRYVQHIYSFVMRYAKNEHDAQDLTQETFVKVWKNLKKFDQKKNFKTWLYTIARNTCIDWTRKKKTVSFSSQDIDEYEIVDEKNNSQENLEGMFDNISLREQIKKIVETLPEKYQTVLFLRYDEELTFQEIADIVDESIDTIKSRYRRALLLIAPKITPHT